MDIQVGKMYLNKKGTIRLITLIKNNKVHFRVVNGPAMKEKPVDYVSMEDFQKWAIDIWMPKSLSDNDYYKADVAIIKNTYVVQNIDGTPEFRCGQARANWYLKKGYAKQIDEGTIRLNSPITVDRFYQLYENLNPFFVSVKNDKCVCCGVAARLTRHHIVPKRVLRLLPAKVKRNMSNILFVCIDCHAKYNESDICTDECNPRMWLEHFIRVMDPKFLPEGWDIFMVKNSPIFVYTDENEVNNG